MKMWNKSIILIVLLLVSGQTVKSQVVQDFETNNKALQESIGWEFQNINFTSAANYLIYGNYSGATTQISSASPWAWIISPWVKVGQGSVTIAMKIDRGTTPRTYTLSAYPYDGSKANGRGTEVKVDSISLFSSVSNQIIPVTFNLPAGMLGKLYKFKFSFNGMVSAAKASVDALTYPGENYTDPTNGGLPKPVIADRDKDGVADDNDQFPDDPYRAYNNFYPTKAGFGSLGFEDNWPKKGDYDLNDVVVDYNINKVTNAANEVVEVKAKFVLRASGARYENGFGFQLDGVAPNKITSVSGCNRSSGTYIKDASNGLEAGQSYATCVVFDNFFSLMPKPGSGVGVNTDPAAPFIPCDTLDVTLTLLNQGQAPAGGKINLSDFPSGLFNFFIIVNKNRGVEVHLPDRIPTSLADRSLFNTADDASKGNVYYKTSKNLPWALNIIQSFDYPVESNAVNSGYIYFNDWAATSGNSYPDWYDNKNGYRHADKIYVTKK